MGLSHRIDKRIFTERGSKGHPIPKHVRLTAILLRWQGSNSCKVHLNQKLLDRAEAWDITEREFHAAVKFLKSWLILPESTAKTLYLAPLPGPGKFLLAPEILLVAPLQPWVIQAILSICCWPASELADSYYMNRKGISFPCLIDFIPQVRGTRSRGSRMADVDVLVDDLITTGLVSLHAIRGKGQWTSEVLLEITPETITGLVAKPWLARASSHADHSVIPRPTLEDHSVIPRQIIASSRATTSVPASVPKQASVPKLAREVAVLPDLEAETNPGPAAIELLLPENDPTMIGSYEESLPQEHTRWTATEINWIGQQAGLKTCRAGMPTLLREFNLNFPPERVHPQHVVQALNPYYWPGLKNRCYSVFFAGQNRDLFIQLVNRLARVGHAWTEALQPDHQFQVQWTQPTEFHVLELENHISLRPGSEKDIAMLYMNHYGMDDIKCDRQGDILVIELPPLTPDIQAVIYPAWIRMVRSGLRTDCDRRVLRQIYRRLQPIPSPTKLELLEQELCLSV